ncbi:glycoside hydrolase family 5 protein [Thelephora ganbajun]|uniref:Glycoside hydrolase family 5 protein n=1 Tax=Thelephora ganbajun TaxID=370292 RepID=A0ACB6Z6M1_THEGA|nr:glycoside hydrolase family 5 protein [Thelephora ganbajun]
MSSLVPEDSIPSTPAAPDNNVLVDTPGWGVNNAPLHPPTPLANLTPLGTSPRDSLTPSATAYLVPETEKNLEENVADEPERRRYLFGRPRVWFAVAAAVVVVVLAVVLPVYFTVAKPKNNTSSGGGGNGGNNGNDTGTPKPPKGLTTGGDGSTIIMENGTEFTYHNPFGGFWVWDPQNPFNDNAQPNSWTPPLNTTWKWGVHKLYGVNIGGWFVLEPFISPALFQRYADAGAIDEWTISTLMAADTTNGGLAQLEHHYDTFITEQDFAEIAGAGLNWIRIPIPWWAIDVWDGEPFLPRTCWKYILRAFQWARKYGLRIMIDLHTAPGSQNAFNHSGKKATFNFLSGPMGYANAQRMVNYIRIFTEFISQPEYVNVAPVFGIINEPRVGTIGKETLTSFNLEVYRIMREITGIGEGKGPYVAISDGTSGPSDWVGLLPNADRLALDTHLYFAFDGQPNTDPINVPAQDGQMGGVWPGRVCAAWKGLMNTVQTDFGVTLAGEYSNGYNDCGFYLRSVEPYTPSNPNCAFWNDWQNWDQATKDGLLSSALASMDALETPFFWTWKIGNTLNGKVEAPLWSYKLGLDNGWMPKDPRKSQGKCAALGVTVAKPFDGNYLSWQTGGNGAGNIPPSATSLFPWPPATISNAGAVPSLLPQYIPAGSIHTLPPPAFTATNVKINGWYDSGDTAPAPTPIPGCSYPNAWGAPNDLPLPIAGCSPKSR